ncbi:MAG: type II toxin-antitoxin system Phd/YefM family antitoxin [Candidatus Omnitrophica bacterium]|nr:type II toxin-antitoxin system Phd/YefM family antitoxin [Candidatus Omnitrophota bacterium]
MMQMLTVTDAKSKFLSLVRRTHDLGELYAITNDGQPFSVLMSYDEYEGQLETIRILKDKVLSAGLLRSLKDADAGETASFEEATGRKQLK